MSKKTDRKKAAGAESVRLDKLLAQEGFGTRSELGRAIRKGSVCVNGEHVKDPGMKVSSEDEILFDGKAVRQKDHVYYMLHKPAGVVSATEDGREMTVLDLLRNPSVTGTGAAGGPERDPLSEPVLRRGVAGKACGQDLLCDRDRKSDRGGYPGICGRARGG